MPKKGRSTLSSSKGRVTLSSNPPLLQVYDGVYGKNTDHKLQNEKKQNIRDKLLAKLEARKAKAK